MAKSGQTQEPSLHPVKLHTSDQPKSGLPSGLTQSFQPDTPEYLQGDEERALSTIYSGLSYSGHSSGDRASPTAAGNNFRLAIGNANQASDMQQYKLVSSSAFDLFQHMNVVGIRCPMQRLPDVTVFGWCLSNEWCSRVL